MPYTRQLKKLLYQEGPYDVVHSHVHHFSGWVLRAAAQCRIPARLAHSHNDIRLPESQRGFLRACYRTVSEALIRRHATVGLAASRGAALSLYGPHWNSDARWRILYYGIDLNPFLGPVDRESIRAEFGIPDDALVVGHVGRFVEQKNHHFFLRIAREISNLEPEARFLFAGDGPLRPGVEAEAASLGLGSRVVFAGNRNDIWRLMRGAMNVFLFPSLFEGLGVVLLEAQAAGLPSVISDAIPDEVDVVRRLISRLSLSEPPQTWAKAVLAARDSSDNARQEGLQMLAHSQFDITASVRALGKLYREAVDGEPACSATQEIEEVEPDCQSVR